jgi:hypothetical protein
MEIRTREEEMPEAVLEEANQWLYLEFGNGA